MKETSRRDKFLEINVVDGSSRIAIYIQTISAMSFIFFCVSGACEISLTIAIVITNPGHNPSGQNPPDVHKHYILSVGILSVGILSGDYVPGDYVQGDFVRFPYYRALPRVIIM